MSFFILFALTFPLMLNMDFVLKIWLKTVPEYAAAFCNIILVSSLLETLSAPLWMTVQAVGKIRKYQLCISATFGLNIIFSYIFLKSGFLPDAVLQINIYVAVLCLTVRLLFVQSYIGIKIIQFIKHVLCRILPVTVTAIVIPFVLSGFYGEWKGLILTSLSFFLTGLFSVYYIGLTESERKMTNGIIVKKLNIIKS
jgi:O-antigen/teichoic acid export membrane protein